MQIWSTMKASKLVYMVPKSDGTPNTALECMAGGVPFIMGNLEYNAELFSNVCLITDLNAPEDFSRKIKDALFNYPAELLENALTTVRKFGDRQNEMHKLEVIYKSING